MKKIEKRYWELPQAQGESFIIAIQNFSQRFALSQTSAALLHLLYGLTWEMITPPGQPSRAVEVPLAKHARGGREIPSNFFAQPEARNISAVIFCNTGTVSKFSRFEFRRNRQLYRRSCT